MTLIARLVSAVRAIDPARRRVRRYDHPDAHRGVPPNPDLKILRHYIPDKFHSAIGGQGNGGRR